MLDVKKVSFGTRLAGAQFWWRHLRKIGAPAGSALGRIGIAVLLASHPLAAQIFQFNQPLVPGFDHVGAEAGRILRARDDPAIQV